MVIDCTYFTGLLSVGMNIGTGVSEITRNAEQDLLDSYIGAYEPEYFNQVLGGDVCSGFLAYVKEQQGEDGAYTPLPLLDSAAAIDNFEELYGTLAATKTANPVACYVFFRYVADGNFKTVRTGTVLSADGDAVTPEQVQIRAWNLMTNRNRKLYTALKNGTMQGLRLDPRLLEPINIMGI